MIGEHRGVRRIPLAQRRWRGLVVLLVLLATACVRPHVEVAAESVALTARGERPSPYRRVLILEDGQLYLERALGPAMAASMPRAEIYSALRSMVAVSADGAATPLGHTAVDASSASDDSMSPEAELAQMLAGAPEGTVAIGYGYRMALAPRFDAEGSYTQAGGRFSSRATLYNPLSAPFPAAGATALLRFDAETTSSAKAGYCLLADVSPNCVMALRAFAEEAKHRYCVPEGIRPGDFAEVVLERDKAAAIYEGYSPDVGPGAFLLCSADSAAKPIPIRWTAQAVHSSASPLACNPAPEVQTHCSRVVPAGAMSVDKPLVAQREALFAERAWNDPMWPLSDPPRARRGVGRPPLERWAYRNVRPGCAFYAGTESEPRVREGDAQLQSHVQRLGAWFVTPQTQALILSWMVQRPVRDYGCPTAVGAEIMKRKTELAWRGLLHARDLEQRALAELEAGADSAMVERLHAAAASMRKLEATSVAEPEARAKILAQLKVLLAPRGSDH